MHGQYNLMRDVERDLHMTMQLLIWPDFQYRDVHCLD